MVVLLELIFEVNETLTRIDNSPKRDVCRCAVPSSQAGKSVGRRRTMSPTACNGRRRWVRPTRGRTLVRIISAPAAPFPSPIRSAQTNLGFTVFTRSLDENSVHWQLNNPIFSIL